MFIFDYFLWHYLKAPKKILAIWGNFLRFFLVYFVPVPQLLKTLLSPWKRDTLLYGRGFEFKRFFETLAMNLFSRLIGAAVRTIVIVIALTLEIITLAAGAAFLIFWLAWPFYLASSIFSGIYSLTKPGLLVLGGLLPVLVGVISIFLFGLAYQKSREKDPTQMSLGEIFEQDWANIIWERVGFQKNQIPENVLNEPEKNLAEFLKTNSIHEKDFSNVVQWQLMHEAENKAAKKFWAKENLFTHGGIGRNWIYGWTNTLDKYSVPTQKFLGSLHLIGRRDELEAMERILCKSQQSNVLLVGEPGVGKGTLVSQFAKLISQGQAASPIAFKKVIQLDLNSALSGLTNEGQTRERLIKIFDEATSAGNIILVIEDFHNFVFGEHDISSVLAPFIEGAYFQLIALTTYNDLHEKIEKNSGLMKFFEKVEVKEPSIEETLLILQDDLPALEKRTGQRITYQAILETVKAADQYIADAPMPEKATDLLEETVLYAAANSKEYFILPKHVDIVVAQKTEIPVGELEAGEKEKLVNLEAYIHQRVIGQEEAVKEISSAMRRARLNVGAKNRPIGNFLFLGPTGVGKTETAKALAGAYFGDEKRMLRFDMSEYQGENAIERMIGSPTNQTPGILTTAVHENPFSLILLDEIEKADAKVLNLFLQILDEGWVTDAFGRKINFRNSIIIATSNAASELIRESTAKHLSFEETKQKILEYIQQNNIFRPEFLNRFDGIVLFQPLTEQEILQVAKLLLADLTKRLSGQDLIFQPSQTLIEKVARLGYDPTFGGRAMRRVIQDKVEDLIAKKMLAGEIQKQTPFEIKAEEIQ